MNLWGSSRKPTDGKGFSFLLFSDQCCQVDEFSVQAAQKAQKGSIPQSENDRRATGSCICAKTQAFMYGYGSFILRIKRAPRGPLVLVHVSIYQGSMLAVTV